MRVLLLAVAAALVAGIIWGVVSGGSTVAPPNEPASPVVLEQTDKSDSLDRMRERVIDRAKQYDSYLIYQLEADRVVRRWADRSARPLRIYYDSDTAPGPEAQRAARRAFDRWRTIANAGIPIVFQEVGDSSHADVQVRWYPILPAGRAGRANVVYSSDGWMVSGELSLAWRTASGVRIPEDALYTVALHEIGHLLGLGHSDDPTDVMFPTTSVHDLTPRDRNTAWLLYQIPPGPVTPDQLR